MALHQLTSFTLGVPNLDDTAAYDREFGLADEGDGWCASQSALTGMALSRGPKERLLIDQTPPS